MQVMYLMKKRDEGKKYQLEFQIDGLRLFRVVLVAMATKTFVFSELIQKCARH